MCGLLSQTLRTLRTLSFVRLFEHLAAGGFAGGFKSLRNETAVPAWAHSCVVSKQCYHFCERYPNHEDQRLN